MTREQVRDSLAARGRFVLPAPPVAAVPPSWWLGREQALRLAADAYELTTTDVISHRRQRRLVEARALFVWACQRFGRPVSYSALGRFLGGRDHTTIINLAAIADRLLRQHGAFSARAQQIAAIAEAERERHHASH